MISLAFGNILVDSDVFGLVVAGTAVIALVVAQVCHWAGVALPRAIGRSATGLAFILCVASVALMLARFAALG